MNIIESINHRLNNRLRKQQGGKGKIMRQFLKRQAKLGRITLPSGFGRSIKVEATA